MQIPQTKQMVSPFAQALAYQNIIDVLDEFDEAPWDQEFILIAKYNLLINAIHDIEINTTLSVEQKQILQEKLIELEHQDKDIKQKALIERMGMPLNNNPNFNYEQWKADNGSNYRYILSQCHNSDDTIKENMKKYIIQDTSKQIENMSNDGQSIDDILTEINLYLNDRASKQNIYLNEEQKQTIYHQIFAILPESIRNACKNADELEQALKLYKNISPYIAFNEDGKPIKVSNAFNAPSPGYDSRAKQVEEKFDSFLIDYTAIHDKETCERFINGEVKHKRLDNTEEAKEAFVRIRKAVHKQLREEFTKILKSNVSWGDWWHSHYLDVNVDNEIEKRMQERIDKNKALCVKKYQRFGESKGDQELLSDIQSVNEEVDRLTHSTQASTKTLKNTLKKYSSLVKNFGKKSEIDGYVKNLEKRSQTVVKKPVTHVQINLPAKRRLDAQTIMSQSKSNLSSSFFSKATTATSSPSQMTFRPNTQEDRVRNITQNNTHQSVTLVPNRTKFLRGAPFGPKPMNTPKPFQR